MLEEITRRISLINRRTLLVSGAILLLLLGYLVFREGGIWGSWRLSQTHAKLESDNKCLREENVLMKRDVEDLKTNRSRIELEARKLGLVYPGEVALMSNQPNAKSDKEQLNKNQKYSSGQFSE